VQAGTSGQALEGALACRYAQHTAGTAHRCCCSAKVVENARIHPCDQSPHTESPHGQAFTSAAARMRSKMSGLAAGWPPLPARAARRCRMMSMM
jgi:hypothetical protein